MRIYELPLKVSSSFAARFQHKLFNFTSKERTHFPSNKSLYSRKDRVPGILVGWYCESWSSSNRIVGSVLPNSVQISIRRSSVCQCQISKVVSIISDAFKEILAALLKWISPWLNQATLGRGASWFKCCEHPTHQAWIIWVVSIIAGQVVLVSSVYKF